MLLIHVIRMRTPCPHCVVEDQESEQREKRKAGDPTSNHGFFRSSTQCDAVVLSFRGVLVLAFGAFGACFVEKLMAK